MKSATSRTRAQGAFVCADGFDEEIRQQDWRACPRQDVRDAWCGTNAEQIIGPGFNAGEYIAWEQRVR
jgi:hypothetical protein